MDLATIRAYPRDYLDLTAADLSDKLLDAWVAEGQRRVLKSRPRWPHLESTETISVVADQRDYTLSTVTRVEAVDNDVVGPVRIIDHIDATAVYWTGVALRSGRPESVSNYGGKVWLWPNPDGDYTLTVYGQRAAVTPTAAGDSPDLPVDLHDVVLEWVMQEAYLQQDDPEMASARKSLFNEKLADFTRDAVIGDDAHPIVFGGGPFQSRRTMVPPFAVRGPGLGQFGGWD